MNRGHTTQHHNQTRSNAGLTLHTLRTLDDMLAWQTAWRQLDASTVAPFVWFQSFEWCIRWMQAYGNPHCQPFVLVLATDDGEAVAILPMMRTGSRLGLTRLQILGDPHTQYANVLTKHGQLALPHEALLRHTLQAEAGVDQVLFHFVPEQAPLRRLAGAMEAFPELANIASQMDLGQFASADAFEKTTGKKSARNLRRAINHFEQAGHLKLEVLRPCNTAFANLVARCLAMKSTWLENTGRVSSGLAYENHDRFLASLQRSGDSADGPLLFALMLNDKPIAIELGFLQRGHYYAYMGAFDWRLRSYSPGKLQMHLSIQWLIAQGVATLDLLGNPSDYKQNYATHETALSGFAMTPTWKGYIYTRLWTGYGRPKAKQIFEKIPKAWRASFHVLRKLEFNVVA